MSRSKVKRQGHQGQKRAVHSHHPRQRQYGLFCCITHCNTLAANNVIQQQTGPFRRCRVVISATCLRFMDCKTSLALVAFQIFKSLHCKHLFYNCLQTATTLKVPSTLLHLQGQTARHILVKCTNLRDDCKMCHGQFS